MFNVIFVHNVFGTERFNFSREQTTVGTFHYLYTYSAAQDKYSTSKLYLFTMRYDCNVTDRCWVTLNAQWRQADDDGSIVLSVWSKLYFITESISRTAQVLSTKVRPFVPGNIPAAGCCRRYLPT